VPFDAVNDPASLNWFLARYGVDTNTLIFGPYERHLANQGESVGLYFPDKPQVPPDPNVGFVPYVLAEEIHYSPLPPWPTGTDATGNSLQRIASVAFGDDPANWQAGAPTPGRLNHGAFVADSDHDGLPDEWELANGLDPKDGNGVNGALGDPDGDGSSNYQEYIAGTDPNNGLDFLRFDRVYVNGAYCVLEFTPRAGRTYAIEKLDDLQPGSQWTTVSGNISGTKTWTAMDVMTPASRFYRLKAALGQ
jgi:hypothetical protein